jgi:hypothetical protein
VRVTGEARHVYADLGDNHLGDPQSDIGDGLQQPDGFSDERVGALGHLPHDLPADARGDRFEFG